MSQPPQATRAGELEPPAPADRPWPGPPWRQGLIGLGLAAVALLLRLALDPVLGDRQPFAFSYAAVALAVWLAGWRAGLLTAVVCNVGGNILFIQPRGVLSIDAQELVGSGAYFLINAVILYLGHRAVTANRALEQVLLELGRANERKSRFLAMLAHELRNPLAALGAGSDALTSERLDAGARAEIHAVMQRQVRQMKRLVDDLLDVGRIDQGRMVLRQAPLAVGPLVRESAAMARAFTDAMGQTLHVDLPTPDCTVIGDADRLMQVLSNLLHNASKFSPRGSAIDLAVRADPAWVHLDVRDTGVGLRPEQLERIFSAQVQLVPRGQHGEGIGLGLSLVRHLVALHGGTVQARSGGPQQGACFTVSLPRATNGPATQPLPVRAAAPVPATAPTHAPAQAAGAPPSVTPLRVLVVEDNADAAASLALVLELHGHTVTVAHDGAQALARADEAWPAIAFVDIGLPDIDGFELARQLRQRAAGRPLRLVALTGWGSDDDLRRAHQAGFDSHHTKPINLDALVTHLARPQPAVSRGSPTAAPG